MSYYCPCMGSMPIHSRSVAWRRADAASWSGGERLPEPTGRTAWRARGERAWKHLRVLVETREQVTVAAIVLGIVVASWMILAFPAVVPWAAYLPLVVLSGALHTPRWHAGVLGLAVAATLLTSAAAGHVKTDGAGAVVATLGVGAITLWRSMSRARVGVQGSRGEAMLADLRFRLLKRARVPALPAGWHAQTCVQSAYAQRFSGDFIVTRRTHGGQLFESLLVDVSGNGLDAGTRALVLSGAFDALLGSVAPDDFLRVANDYVARQDWSEGFATAVYLRVDVKSGEYAVSCAGHPPAASYRPETGWRVLDDAAGPALGLIPGIDYASVTGRLAPGEALMLYTDGLIEARGCGIDEGIGRLMDGLTLWTHDGFAGIASQVCSTAPSGQCDDRGAVVVWCE